MIEYVDLFCWLKNPDELFFGRNIILLQIKQKAAHFSVGMNALKQCMLYLKFKIRLLIARA